MKWNFDNSYSKLPDSFKEIIKPVSVLNPELIIFNERLADELGLDFSKIKKNELSALFAGNILPEGTSSIAQAYAGHQFGHFTICFVLFQNIFSLAEYLSTVIKNVRYIFFLFLKNFTETF